MKRKKTTGLERVNKCMLEVAPLHIREPKMNTRKGMNENKNNKKDGCQAVLPW